MVFDRISNKKKNLNVKHSVFNVLQNEVSNDIGAFKTLELPSKPLFGLGVGGGGEAIPL